MQDAKFVPGQVEVYDYSHEEFFSTAFRVIGNSHDEGSKNITADHRVKEQIWDITIVKLRSDVPKGTISLTPDGIGIFGALICCNPDDEFDVVERYTRYRLPILVIPETITLNVNATYEEYHRLFRVIDKFQQGEN